jgi:hypothetical protein
MRLESEQEDLLARMVEGTRDVPRSERKWLLMRYSRGAFFSGPGIDGREDVPEGDVLMLERVGLIYPIAYSRRDSNPTFVLTPEALAHYADTRDNEPAVREESELRRFLDSEAFGAEYPRAYATWSEADVLLWRADSEREFTTVGHKTREALQEFASEAVERYGPPEVVDDPALVNKRLGAVIAKFLPVLGNKRAALLRALGDYSEATLDIVQRQEHGGQKEGEDLTWHDARRVVFHAASVMYELALEFRDAASRS